MDDINKLLSQSLSSALGTHAYMYNYGGRMLCCATDAAIPVRYVIYHLVYPASKEHASDEDIRLLLQTAFPKAMLIAAGQTKLDAGQTTSNLTRDLTKQLSQRVLEEVRNNSYTPPAPLPTQAPTEANTPAITTESPPPKKYTPSDTPHYTPILVLSGRSIWFRLIDEIRGLVRQFLIFIIIFAVVVLPLILLISTHFSHTQSVQEKQRNAETEHAEKYKQAFEKSEL